MSTLVIGGLHSAAGNEEPPTQKTTVQIVNATSVAAISLKINGKLHYPDFAQGLQSGEFSIENLSPTYTIIDHASQRQLTRQIAYEAKSYQSLILTGDFRPVTLITAKGKKTLEPYAEFNVLSHVLEPDREPLRYRFLNGLSENPITISEGDQEWVIKPGQVVSFYGQPAVKTFTVKIQKKPIEVLIRQNGGTRNCSIIFYKKEGIPHFLRVFENTPTALETSQN